MHKMDLGTVLGDFFDICNKIAKLSEQKIKSVLLKNPINSHLAAYEKLYEKTKPEEHIDFFLPVFVKNRFNILADRSDKWLLDGDISIQFNEGSKLANPKYRIHVSALYKKACDLRSLAKDQGKPLVKMSKDVDPSSIFPEIKYPDMFIFYLYRVFTKMLEIRQGENALPKGVEKDSIEKLTIITTKFETHLGLSQQGPGAPAPTQQQPLIPTELVAGLGDSLGSIFQTVQKIADRSGATRAPGGQMPSANQLSDLVTGFFTNPKLNNVFKSVANAVGDAQGPQEAINRALKQINNDDVVGSITGILSDTMGTVSQEPEPAQTQRDLLEFDASPATVTDMPSDVSTAPNDEPTYDQ
jgi:hypothetical protein